MGVTVDAGTALRGAAAGAVAAAAWASVEPAAARALGTDYTDVRLLGRLVTERGWAPAGLALHVANGAAFGAAFAVAGGRGPRAGAAWALAESAAAWPAMALMDRVHPDRRSGRWPRLLTSPRVFLQETLMHGLFGVVLGLLVPRRR
ncbi:MAG: hypothetical protein AB7V62_15155 [Thermoleophilia bacterium]